MWAGAIDSSASVHSTAWSSSLPTDRANLSNAANPSSAPPAASILTETGCGSPFLGSVRSLTDCSCTAEQGDYAPGPPSAARGDCDDAQRAAAEPSPSRNDPVLADRAVHPRRPPRARESSTPRLSQPAPTFPARQPRSRHASPWRDTAAGVGVAGGRHWRSSAPGDDGERHDRTGDDQRMLDKPGLNAFERIGGRQRRALEHPGHGEQQADGGHADPERGIDGRGR